MAAPYAYARPLGLPVAAPLAVAHRPAYAAPYAVGPAIAKVAAPVDEYDPNPQYSYAYDIQDALTGKWINLEILRRFACYPYPVLC